MDTDEEYSKHQLAKTIHKIVENGPSPYVEALKEPLQRLKEEGDYDGETKLFLVMYHLYIPTKNCLPP